MEIRKIVPADLNEVAQVYVASWKDAYHGIVPQNFLDSLHADR